MSNDSSRKVFLVVGGGNPSAERHFEDTIQRKRTLQEVGIGGENLWRSRQALREEGRVVVYGFQAKLHGGRMSSGTPSGTASDSRIRNFGAIYTSELVSAGP